MGDPVTAALMKEAGQTRRSTDAAQAADAVRALSDPNLGAEDSPAQRAERQAQIARQASIAGEPAPVAAPASVAATQQAANDPVTTALLGEAKGIGPKDVPDQAAPVEPVPEPSKLDRAMTIAKAGLVGPGEAALSAASGVVGGVVGSAAGLVKGVAGGKYGTAEGAREAAAYAQEVARSLTYEPRTEAGREVLSGVGTALEQSGANRLAGLGPAEGMALAGLSAAPRAAGAVSRGTPAAATTPAVAGKGGSVGASGVAPAEQVRALAAQVQTAALRQELERAAPKATPFTLKTAERVVAADTLPVPIKLTAGQATQDVSLLSQEQNARGAKKPLADRFNEQNTQLAENLREIRERAAPDVFATSRPALGETIIDAYKVKDAALNKTISQNYKALKDANGGSFPMDAKAFADNAYKKLHADLKAEFVPAGIEKQLEGFQKGKMMTFEQFESMRTNLANVMRSNADGNIKQAAALIRDALEELPMPAGAEHLKPLADTARTSARERFALIAADPAYKAVVRGKASADRFIDKYVLNADTKSVETMKANLAHDATAQQSMTAGALRRLEDRAGLIDYSGNFSTAGYNKALEGMGSKLGILFDPESKKLVEQLGAVSRYVKGQPTGSFVNNSNTAVSLMAEGAKSAAAGAANVAAHGIPVGTWARKIGGFVKEQKELNRSLQTGAGLRLKDVAK